MKKIVKVHTGKYIKPNLRISIVEEDDIVCSSSHIEWEESGGTQGGDGESAGEGWW